MYLNLSSKITYLHSRTVDSWNATGAAAKQLENPESKDQLTILFIRPTIIEFFISEIRRESCHSTELASGIKSEDSCGNQIEEVCQAHYYQAPSSSTPAHGLF